MVLTKTQMTVEAFDEWVLQPENADHDYEYIGGEIVEVVSNQYSSEIGMYIGAMITVYVTQHRLGRVTGADGGYKVEGERYIPDAAFISLEKQPYSSTETYNSNPPDLAVEVLSPTNSAAQMRIKVVNYLRAGTLLWVVDPDAQTVEVYAPDKKAQRLTIDAILDGGSVLLGFTLPIKDIFPEKPPQDKE